MSKQLFIKSSQSCGVCEKLTPSRFLIDVKNTAQEMLFLLPTISESSPNKQRFNFIWSEISHRSKQHTNALICDNCFNDICVSIRECMGATKHDFANYMNPKEVMVVQKVQKELSLLSGSYSKKRANSLKK